jgi:hypothetical protein
MQSCSKQSLQAPPAAGSVRGELANLQDRTGLTLEAFDYGSIRFVSFPDRELVRGKDFTRLVGNSTLAVVAPDGRQVAVASGTDFAFGILHLDGATLRRYSNHDLDLTNDICWSPDMSKVALLAAFPTDPETTFPPTSRGLSLRHIRVLDLASGTWETTFEGSYLTSQCWSPDGTRIVYQADQGVPGSTIRVYNLVQKQSQRLVEGSLASWSPDGQWIAFFVDGAYYTIHPSGEGRKSLFELKQPVTGLWWSPDSRMVAYLTYVELWDSTRSTLEYLDWPSEYRIQVRRLSDNSEDWVAQLTVPWMLTEYWAPLSFQWTRKEKP